MRSPRTYRMLNFVENNIALALLTLTIIIVDRLVKFYITELIKIGEVIPVLGSFFQITRVINTGAAFGILQGWSLFFIISSFIVFGLIIIWYNKIMQSKLLVFATAFILGGTVGNMLDRAFFGHVIDYLHIIFWPSFNLSDMALTVGAILLVIYMFRDDYRKEEHIDFARY